MTLSTSTQASEDNSCEDGIWSCPPVVLPLSRRVEYLEAPNAKLTLQLALLEPLQGHLQQLVSRVNHLEIVVKELTSVEHTREPLRVGSFTVPYTHVSLLNEASVPTADFLPSNFVSVTSDDCFYVAANMAILSDVFGYNGGPVSCVAGFSNKGAQHDLLAEMFAVRSS